GGPSPRPAGRGAPVTPPSQRRRTASASAVVPTATALSPRRSPRPEPALLPRPAEQRQPPGGTAATTPDPLDLLLRAGREARVDVPEPVRLVGCGEPVPARRGEHLLAVVLQVQLRVRQPPHCELPDGPGLVLRVRPRLDEEHDLRVGAVGQGEQAPV